MAWFLRAEGRASALQKALIEVDFAAGHGFLEVHPHAFEYGKAGSSAVGAGRIVIFDAHEEGIVGGFKLRQSPQGFDLARETAFLFQSGALIAEVGAIPAQGIAGQAGDFVIKVGGRVASTLKPFPARSD